MNINAWANIFGSQVTGPIHDNMTRDRHQQFLQHELGPVLSASYPDHIDPDFPNEGIWIHQDGATTLYL